MTLTLKQARRLRDKTQVEMAKFLNEWVLFKKNADHLGIKKSDIIEPSQMDELRDTIDVNSEETELITSYRKLSSDGKRFLKGIMGQLKNFNVASTL